jgi:hypothetical protein
MIESDEQAQITMDWIKRFSKDIDDLEFKIIHGEESRMLRACINGMKSQLDSLYEELAEYQQRTTG